jgi:phosphate transport system substrate-binding protein
VPVGFKIIYWINVDIQVFYHYQNTTIAKFESMGLKKISILKVFSATMAVVYIIAGIWVLLAGDNVIPINNQFRILLGILLLLYGAFRCYNSFRGESSNKHLLIVITALFAVVFVSCHGPNSKEKKKTQDTVNVYVDETFRPIIEAGYDMFSYIDTLSVMNIYYVPEEEAFSQLLNLKATLAVVSRQLLPSEEKLLNEKTYYPHQTKIAVDAIAVITNRSIEDSVISVKQIRDILTGRISSWKQLNGHFPDKPIRLLFDNSKSGIVRYMADSVCNGEKMNSKAFALDVNTDVVDYVSNSPDVIGFIGVSWISNSKDSLHLSFHNKIKVLYLTENLTPTAENSYQPFQAYMLDGMYPFTRNIYMINAEPKYGKATRFTNFMAGQKGQRIILKSGILPVNAPLRLVNVRENI